MEVREVLYPFYIVSTLCGFSFFDLPRRVESLPQLPPVKSGTLGVFRCKRRFLVRLAVTLFYVAIISGNVALSVCQIFYAKFFSKDAFTTATGQWLSSGLFTFTGVMCILSLLHSIYMRQEVRLLVQKLINFDDLFQSSFGRIDHVKHRRVVFGYISCLFLAASFLIFTSHWSMEQTDYKYILTFDFILFGITLTMNYGVLQSHVVLSIAAVLVRFKAINRELEKILQDGNNRQERSLLRGRVERIQRCRILHDILNDFAELINLCFSFHAMWCTLSCFGFCLMSLYNDYEILANPMRNWKVVLVNFGWNFYYTIFTICIVWVASRMAKEANHTSVVVHKIINVSAEPLLTDEVL